MNDLKSFILDNNFKITISNNTINILNYNDIKILDKTLIIIDNNIIIKGNNLFVKCLMNDEILITGIIKLIEFR